MKILTISDEECPALWDYYTPGRLDGYDLIISCGDLKAKYLSFLVTMAKCPVLYVPGNHDTSYEHEPPEGCDCIDDHIVTYNGIRILGLGGCRKYHPGRYQYTENQMRRRIARLRWKLYRLKGVDIVVTHAAPEGLGDDEDRAHWGFASFRELLDKYHPAYLVHGHVHMSYGHKIPREIDYNGTRVINAYERYTIEIPDRPVKTKHLNQVIYKTRVKHNDYDEVGLIIK
ncbi:MAG: metallophosphoesterase family protein [Oscillospiraceae bacterium]|nr:metallophosphoesterase family protein [Oscillospiraceae bacterium]